MELLLVWLLSTIALILTAWLIPGFKVSNFGAALVAAAVAGIANATIGFVLKILVLPLTILTLGLAHLAVNALMLMLASALVPGFKIDGCLPALLGALVVSLLNLILHSLVF